ncbi:MAG: hypothetical protein RRC07_11950 [Anaerolineae bacterium]|nr:hypothetical protein [Anaerolineae bacterium]
MSRSYSQETGRILDDFLQALGQRGGVDRQLLDALHELRADEGLSSPTRVQQVVEQLQQARRAAQDEWQD